MRQEARGTHLQEAAQEATAQDAAQRARQAAEAEDAGELTTAAAATKQSLDQAKVKPRQSRAT